MSETKTRSRAAELYPWPTAPEQWRAFAVMLIPATKGGGWQRRRLSALTPQELDWFVETIRTEVLRRGVRDEAKER